MKELIFDHRNTREKTKGHQHIKTKAILFYPKKHRICLTVDSKKKKKKKGVIFVMGLIVLEYLLFKPKNNIIG